MKWIYKSHIGIISIVPFVSGRWTILFNNDKYGSYLTPNQAADDVRSFSTGCDDWDLLCSNPNVLLNVPSGLEEWKRQ